MLRRKDSERKAPAPLANFIEATLRTINSKYWQEEGATKQFTHELQGDWLLSFPKDTWVLDMGCGYGRVTRELYNRGYHNIVGYDPSQVMISRAEKENPGPLYTSSKKDLGRHQYGLFICFALFTSSPEPESQSEIVALIEQHSRGKACIYLSDYLTSKNPQYSERYNQCQLGLYGCFGSTESGIFRHHHPDHFPELLVNWQEVAQESMGGKTLNGNEITITQSLFIKENMG